MRSVSRVFLQAWTLLLLDPEDRGQGRKHVGGLSDQFLMRHIREQHLRIYEGSRLEWKELRTFLQYERVAANGILRGTARDNFVRWENVTPEIIDVRMVLRTRVAGMERPGMMDKRRQEGEEEQDVVMRLLGFR